VENSAIFLNVKLFQQHSFPIYRSLLKIHLDGKTLRRYNVSEIYGGDIMGTLAKRATIYMDPAVHKALKLKAIYTSRSVSDLVNEAIKEALAEDAEDLASFKERGAEPLLSYDEMVTRLKKDGRI
jgi:hypothetical protein